FFQSIGEAGLRNSLHTFRRSAQDVRLAIVESLITIKPLNKLNSCGFEHVLMSVNVKFPRTLDDKRKMGAKGFQILVFVFQLVFVFGTFPDTDVTGLVVVLTVRRSSFDQAMQWKSGVWAVLTIALWIFFDIAGSEERFFKSLVWILCFNMIRGLI
ncbi:hypothetical protein AA0121_g13659, partial [Alternaria tenuissima]